MPTPKTARSNKIRYIYDLMNVVPEHDKQIVANAISATSDDIIKECIAESFPYQLDGPWMEKIVEVGRESVASIIVGNKKPSEILFKIRITNAIGDYLRKIYA